MCLRSIKRAAASVPVYAPVGTAAYVLGVASGTVIPGEWLVRPLATGVIAAIIVQLVFFGATGHGHLGALLAAVIIAAVIGVDAGVVIVVAILGTGLWVIGSLRSQRSGLRLARMTPFLNLVASLWVAVAGIGALSRIADLPSTETRQMPAGRMESPDLYVLLLDGYARADTLASWGFDNSPFVKALEERGFYVSTQARSDYDYTGGTVPSMMQMSLLEDLDLEWPEPGPGRDQLVWTLANDSPAVRALEAAGYKTYATDSHSAPASLRTVDEFLDSGTITEFEAYLIEATRLDGLLRAVARDWFPDQYRQRVLSNFESVRRVADEPSKAPRFVWGHILSPHAPFVLAADGSLAPPLSCYPTTCGIGAGQSVSVAFHEFVGRYTAQVAYLNSEVVRTVDAILEAEPSAVVIVLSDHGSRYDAQTDYDEWFRILFAARTPGQPKLYGDDPRPRDVFRTFLRTYVNRSDD